MAGQRARAVTSLADSRPVVLTEAGGGGGGARQEVSMARAIRAQCLASGRGTGDIARAIHQQCGPAFGTTPVRAHRLALGIALADVVAQVRARYVSEGRPPPRFSETLLSSYESGQKRPGPEYLHYLCWVYQAEAEDLGYEGPCLCGQRHHCFQHGSFQNGGLRHGDPPIGSPPPAPPTGLADPAGPARRPQALARPRPAPPGVLPAAPRRAGLRAVGGPLAEPSPGEVDDDVIRRTSLRLMAAVAGPVDSRFFGAVERVRRRLDDALAGATVSVGMLDHWEAMASEHGRRYMTVPPLELLCDVLLDLGDVRRMCEQRQPLDFADRLCRLAARLSGLAGLIMIDAGDQRLARSFFATARTAADETGDRRLRAWVAVRGSLVPLYYGDPAQAAAAARASAGLAGQRPCVASVMAPVVEARALARLGRPARASAGPGRLARASAGSGRAGTYAVSREALRRASAALDRAHDALGALPDDERRCTAFGYTERQLLFHQGDALVDLGDHRAADDAFGQAIRLYSADEFLDRSLVSLGQARCRLAASEPEEALRLSRETLLRLPSQHRHGLVLRAARALGEAVAAKHGDFPAVRDYREALLTG